MGTPKVKVRLEDKSKITAPLDTGAKINGMTKEVIEDVGLAIKQGPKPELVLHTRHSQLFLAFVKMLRLQ